GHKRAGGGTAGREEGGAKTRPFGAWIDYFLPREMEGGVAIAVSDSSGRAVRSLTGPGEAGFHRVVWDLTAGDPKLRIRRSELSGQPPLVRPGRYRIEVRAGRSAPRSRALEVPAIPGTYLSEM